MSFWGWFTGGSKTVNKGLDMLDRGIDMAILNGDEQSWTSQKGRDGKLKWIQATTLHILPFP